MSSKLKMCSFTTKTSLKFYDLFRFVFSYNHKCLSKYMLINEFQPKLQHRNNLYMYLNSATALSFSSICSRVKTFSLTELQNGTTFLTAKGH